MYSRVLILNKYPFLKNTENIFYNCFFVCSIISPEPEVWQTCTTLLQQSLKCVFVTKNRTMFSKCGVPGCPFLSISLP